MTHSILVVDDEAPIRELLSRWLEAEGYDLREADSAERALEMMAQRSAAVVLCDIEMPGHGGLWLAEQLREGYPASAMILATALDSVPPSTSFKPGIIDYLVKPFERASVVRAVAASAAWHTGAAERLRKGEPARESIAGWLESIADDDET